VHTSTSSSPDGSGTGVIDRLAGRLPSVMDRLPKSLRGLLEFLQIDLPRGAPLPGRLRLAIATVVSIVGSVAADAGLVALAKAMWPATKHYSHFQFADYTRLTVVGVLIACVGWPIVTMISSAARRLFLRLAVVVTLALFLPDIWILLQHQPVRAVAMLMVMHVAIALVTYNALVRIAPVDTDGGELPEQLRPRAEASSSLS
jgi:hypothetical protein